MPFSSTANYLELHENAKEIINKKPARISIITEFNQFILSPHFPAPQQQFDSVFVTVTLSDKRKNSVTFRTTKFI